MMMSDITVLWLISCLVSQYLSFRSDSKAATKKKKQSQVQLKGFVCYKSFWSGDRKSCDVKVSCVIAAVSVTSM